MRIFLKFASVACISEIVQRFALEFSTDLQSWAKALPNLNEASIKLQVDADAAILQKLDEKTVSPKEMKQRCLDISRIFANDELNLQDFYESSSLKESSVKLKLIEASLKVRAKLFRDIPKKSSSLVADIGKSNPEEFETMFGKYFDWEKFASNQVLILLKVKKALEKDVSIEKVLNVAKNHMIENIHQKLQVDEQNKIEIQEAKVSVRDRQVLSKPVGLAAVETPSNHLKEKDDKSSSHWKEKEDNDSKNNSKTKELERKLEVANKRVKDLQKSAKEEKEDKTHEVCKCGKCDACRQRLALYSENSHQPKCSKEPVCQPKCEKKREKKRFRKVCMHTAINPKPITITMRTVVTPSPVNIKKVCRHELIRNHHNSSFDESSASRIQALTLTVLALAILVA